MPTTNRPPKSPASLDGSFAARPRGTLLSVLAEPRDESTCATNPRILWTNAVELTAIRQARALGLDQAAACALIREPQTREVLSKRYWAGEPVWMVAAELRAMIDISIRAARVAKNVSGDSIRSLLGKVSR